MATTSGFNVVEKTDNAGNWVLCTEMPHKENAVSGIMPTDALLPRLKNRHKAIKLAKLRLKIRQAVWDAPYETKLDLSTSVYMAAQKRHNSKPIQGLCHFPPAQTPAESDTRKRWHRYAILAGLYHDKRIVKTKDENGDVQLNTVLVVRKEDNTAGSYYHRKDYTKGTICNPFEDNLEPRRIVTGDDELGQPVIKMMPSIQEEMASQEANLPVFGPIVASVETDKQLERRTNAVARWIVERFQGDGITSERVATTIGETTTTLGGLVVPKINLIALSAYVNTICGITDGQTISDVPGLAEWLKCHPTDGSMIDILRQFDSSVRYYGSAFRNLFNGVVLKVEYKGIPEGSKTGESGQSLLRKDFFRLLLQELSVAYCEVLAGEASWGHVSNRLSAVQREFAGKYGVNRRQTEIEDNAHERVVRVKADKPIDVNASLGTTWENVVTENSRQARICELAQRGFVTVSAIANESGLSRSEVGRQLLAIKQTNKVRSSDEWKELADEFAL